MARMGTDGHLPLQIIRAHIPVAVLFAKVSNDAPASDAASQAGVRCAVRSLSARA